MQIQDLPFPDPGAPDARLGPPIPVVALRNQLSGQLKSLAWGLLHFASVASLPFCVGVAVPGRGRPLRRPARAGRRSDGVGLRGQRGRRHLCLHRAAVTNWITAAARVQQLLARKAAALGSALTRRVAAGEVVAVSTGDVEKIGWFVEALSRFTAAAVTIVLVCVGLVVYQPALGVVVAVGLPVLAIAVLPLLPRATRRADVQREKAGRATELASDIRRRLRVLRRHRRRGALPRPLPPCLPGVRHAAVRSARMWALIAAIQVLLPGILLITVVWYGVHLAREGRIAVGELVTVYSSVMVLTYPLRHLEEIAMAYSFSRPSAKRASRVLSLERGPRTPRVARRREPVRRPVRPGDRSARPRGRLTAVVCGDPDAAGRLAERLGDTPPSRAPRCCSAGCRSTNCRWTPPAGPSSCRTRIRCCSPGTLRELLDVPASGAVDPRDALDAARCGDVLAALVQGSVDAADPMDAADHRARTVPVRGSASGSRWPGRWSRTPEVPRPGRADLAVDSHTRPVSPRGCGNCGRGALTVVFTSLPLLLDRADRVVFLHDGAVAAVGDHRELVRAEPRYRAVVTRETEDEAARAGSRCEDGVLREDEVLHRLEQLEEIEETA
ncbi:ABC transporter ATP-binding protein [Streptomyces heliomycini]